MTGANRASIDQRVRDAFNEIVETPEAQREDAICAMDLSESDRALLSKLLAGYAKQRLFAHTAADWARHLDNEDFTDALLGKRIGDCELLKFLGSGGSSVVYLARREVGETWQSVAVKILHTGLLSPDAHRRFRREQAILSRLSHPNIAVLLDAGISEASTPYIVMEYVQGVDVLTYADRISADVRTRISLLIDICRAADAAHTSLVVHRDLKPSNVLVTQDGVVKVLDFGIAKLMDDDMAHTATQHVALTPAYAAPEQFRPGPAATSMDVYALGVLASELLLGGRLGVDASLPSSGSTTTWQRWRRMDTDLTHIIRAALASEPSRRYSSAGHLADDFLRYLSREPLQIVPVSRWYRTRKFASRHRTAVSAAVLFSLAVLVGTIGIFYQWRVAQEQAVLARQQAIIAQEQAARAEAIRDFVVSIFDAGTAEVPKDRRPSIEDIVADAGLRLKADEKLGGAFRVDMLMTLSDVASSIGADDRASMLLDAIDRIVQNTGVPDRELALQMAVRRAGLFGTRRTSAGEKIVELLTPFLSSLQSRSDVIGVKGIIYYSQALQMLGRSQEALKVTEDLVNHAIATEKPVLTIQAMEGQLNVAIGIQHYADASKFAESAGKYWEDHGRPWNPASMSLWGDIAIAREAVGDIDGAEQAYLQAIDIGDRIFSHPNLEAASIIGIYGTFLLAQSRLDDAKAPIRRALLMEEALFGENDPRIAQALYGMAKLFAARSDLGQASIWISKEIDLLKNEGSSVRLARAYAARAKLGAQAGDFPSADRDITMALDIQQGVSGNQSPGYAWILNVAADIQFREGRYRESLQSTDRVLALTTSIGGSLLQSVLDTRFTRAKALLMLGQKSEGISELMDIEKSYASIAPKSPVRFEIAANEAIALSEASRLTEARGAARIALELQPVNASTSTLAKLQAIASEQAPPNPAK